MSSYNQKLFSGGLRNRLHTMRFRWLHKHLREEADTYTLFELGCFDCRSLTYLPKPKQYLGADAGWEGGLNDAQMTFVKKPWVELVMTHSVHDLKPYEGRKFDYSIALETLEHIPDAVLTGYLEFLARITKKRLLITVPVEVGLVFFVKHLAKKILPHLENGETESYTLAEIYWATRGRVDRVARYEHKGFDYRKLVTLLGKHFDVTHVEGLPIRYFPHLSFQVGIIAEPKPAPLVGEIL